MQLARLLPCRTLAVLALVLAGAVAAPGAGAQQSAAEPLAPSVEISSTVSYQLVGRLDIDALNTILTVDTPKFFGVDDAYTPATNAVRLYRVTYGSVIPEQGNRPTVASGLLAVPEVEATRLPLVSYQHGTVYGKEQVPSFADQSPETQLMIAQFAGQGYLLIGADYFGLGTSAEPEGYMVKASHQQATQDMLAAGRAVIAHLGLADDGLYLGGWSQGGFVTLAMLERLEKSGTPVKATATASAPIDVFAALNGFLSYPRANDADWVNSLFILSAFSFENYYGVPGLARSLIKDEHYEMAHIYSQVLASLPWELLVATQPDEQADASAPESGRRVRSSRDESEPRAGGAFTPGVDEEAGYTAAQPDDRNSGGLRALFKRLVTHLHPDKVQDAQAKAERTLAMKEVTQAYQAGDLARLLEIERTLAEDLLNEVKAGEVAQRVRRLISANEALLSQLRTLTRERKALRDSLPFQFDLRAPRRLREQAQAQAREIVAGAEEEAAHYRAIREFVERFARGKMSVRDFALGPQSCAPWDADALVEAMLEELFANEPVAHQHAGRGRRR